MSIPAYEILNGIRKHHNVVFEDNKVVYMEYKDIILSRYLWELTNFVPGMKITSDYVASKYFSEGMYTSKTINKCFEVMLRDIVNNYLNRSIDRSSLSTVYEQMFLIVVDIYNEVVYSNLNYATTLNIKDFLEIQFKPKLIEAMRKVGEDSNLDNIQNSYDVLDDICRNDPSLSNNIVAKGYIAGTFSANQLRQMLASRGYVTEIDSRIFKYPIASSFVLGFNSIYELAIESRSGAKALFLSNIAIRDSEYFARELQLVTMIVENLVNTDCGTKEYTDWYIRGAEVTGKSDLEFLIGKRYFDPISNKEYTITGDENNLVGKVIKLRTAYNCKLKHKNSICTACFGGLSHAVFEHTNLGHITTTNVTKQISQSILSTKHIVANATSSSIELSDIAAKFFTVKNKNGYGIKSSLLKRTNIKMSIIIEQKEAFGIKDLNNDVDVYKLNPARVSMLQSIIMVTTDKQGNSEYYPIVVTDGNKYGNITYEFLEYIVRNGYTLDDQDRYVIDLSGWTTTTAIIQLPQVEFNFLALAKNVKSRFKYLKLNKQGRSIETPESLLQIVFDLINSKLNINVALLEVIIYAFIIYDRETRDYDLGRNAKDRDLDRIEGVMTNRSLGSSLAWEKQVDTLLSPKSYYGRNAIDTPLDVLLKPNECIKDYYGSVDNPSMEYRKQRDKV